MAFEALYSMTSSGRHKEAELELFTELVGRKSTAPPGDRSRRPLQGDSSRIGLLQGKKAL